MTFNNLPYKRPDVDVLIEKAQAIESKLTQESNPEKAIEIIQTFFQLQDDVDMMAQLANIRYSLNTSDHFYEEERTFFDEQGPNVTEAIQKVIHTILSLEYREALTNHFGALFFNKYEQQIKTFHPSIKDNLVKENKLVTEYSKLIASARIEFDGQTLNLSKMAPYMQSLDRNIRHQAQLAVSHFFESKEDALDDIYDQLVQVRHQIAGQLGYENFIQLGYDRLGRLDYTQKDVEVYRKQIEKDVVPYVQFLVSRQQKRLKLDNIKSYDMGIKFLSGSAKPKGDKDTLLKAASTMYQEMDPTIHQFFEFMLDHELLDLDARENKESGGYATLIPNYGYPFIFANFNGTANDVDVLTHEAGHALQMYLSKDLIPEYRHPTLEAAEIHSMSMEFFAWPWMAHFFKEDTQKYYFQHLAGSLSFLPYGALVDHFQHEVYGHPFMSKEERKNIFHQLEKRYMPHTDYDDDAFLNKGTYWYRQIHIFSDPFYYIDYTLAQVVAFYFWHAYREDKAKALKTYLSVCKVGGSLTFSDILKHHDLPLPFHENMIASLMKPLQSYLDSIDDQKL
jgi:M3 family oligoendopeptidase